MEVSSILQKHYKDDSSWINAMALVDSHLALNHNHWNFFRNAWNSHLSTRDIIKILGFSKMGVESLLSAAGMNGNQQEMTINNVEQAINYLGIRYSAVVLAANYCCELLYKLNPNLPWQRILSEMGTYIEIGYTFGQREPGIGPEGGALLGFASQIPNAIFAIEQPNSIRELLSLDDFKIIQEFEKNRFKCTREQIAAFVIQKLGFGTSIAVAVALAIGRFPIENISANNDDEIQALRAALLWIEALRTGRGYPAEKNVREFFPNLSPPKDRGIKNTNLEVLYTEIAKIRSQGSKWRWHYPKDLNHNL